MRRAAACCFVFSILMSLLLSENKATSAPDMANDNNSNDNKRIIRKVVPCVFIASKTKEMSSTIKLKAG
jgi:hypothetical protein